MRMIRRREDRLRPTEGAQLREVAVLERYLTEETDPQARIEIARLLKLPVWIGAATVEKRRGDYTAEQVAAGEHLREPVYEIVHGTPNLLMYGGASNLWQYGIGNGTTTADQTLTYLSNARAALGVGDSSTAAAATQTDLQAATNKLRKAMEATYPTHTDGVIAGAATITFRSSFATGEANFVWNEWGLFNSATAATGRMINRKVESLGTKASGVWTLTTTLTLA